ncbi:MAG TPA: HAD family hydrolase [Solimonas sp.]|nr:HAD family hydrolase [Solimonas sp.]
MRLAIFDLDHTLLAGDSDYLWGQFLCEQGIVDRVSYARENQRFYRDYQAGTLDIAAFAAFSLKPLADHTPAQLEAWHREFMQTHIEPIVAPGAVPLLERHRAQGDTLLITTATNTFVTAPIARLLGVPNLIATDPEMRDGRYTGRVAGAPNFQAGKVLRLEAWLTQQPQRFEHLTCYSDSRNDIPLLERADHAVAVDPDEVLRRTALERGWPVISLRGQAFAQAES